MAGGKHFQSLRYAALIVAAAAAPVLADQAPKAPAAAPQPGLLAVTAATSASTDDDIAVTGDDSGTTPSVVVKARPTGWKEKFRGSSASFSSSVGTGTFVADEFADSPYLDTSLSFSVRYKLAPKHSLNAGWGLTYELSTPDNAEGRRFTPNNTTLGYSYSYGPLLAKINLSASARVALPTSYESQYNGTIFNLTVGPNLSRSFLKDKLTLALTSRFTKYVPNSPNRGLRNGDPNTGTGKTQTGETPNYASAYCREGANFCSGGSLNANYSFYNSLSLSYSFTEKLSASLSAGVTNVFKYSVPEVNSDPNLPLTGRSDTTEGGLSVGYQLTPRYSLSGGFSSSMPALTDDQTSIRFPIYDFTSPANNYTSWFASLDAVY